MATDIACMITEDHRSILEILRTLAGTRPADLDFEERHRLVDDLTRLVDLHLDSEEAVVTPVLPQLLSTMDAAIDLDLVVAEELADHESLRYCLATLNETPPDHPRWERTLDDVRRAVFNHIEVDETEVLPAVWQADLPDAEALGAQFADMRARRSEPSANTRPARRRT
jgi:hypothetical protein